VSRDESKPRTRSPGPRLIESVAWGVVLTGLWASTLTALDAIELVVAGVCGLACGALATATRTSLGVVVRPRARWLTWLLRLPVAVVTDLGRLVLAVARSVRHGTPLGTVRTLALPVEPSGVARTRRALGSLAISATPGSYVLDVVDDPDSPASTLTLHALTEEPSALERSVAR
jgi:multisubunit Na+/H+ antiporter MnhE subunit